MKYDKSKSKKRAQSFFLLASVFIFPYFAFAVDIALAETLASVDSGKGTGGLVVAVESRLKEPFVLRSYKVHLDGKIILRKKAKEKGEEAVSFDALPVGSHKVKVKALYSGSGYGVFDYHEDYKYSAEGEYGFEIKEGRVIILTVVCDDRSSFLTDLKKRPFISFEPGIYTAPSKMAKRTVVPSKTAVFKKDVPSRVMTPKVVDRPVLAGMVRGKYVTGLSVEKFDSGLKVHVVGDGSFDRYDAFRLNDPERIVVDIFSVKELIGNDSLKVRSPYLTKVRVGQHEDVARIVLDIPSKLSKKYRVEPEEKGLSILLGQSVTRAGKATSISRRSGVTAGGSLITGLAVEDAKESVKLIISGEGTLDRYEASQIEKPDRIVIDILGVKEVLDADSLNVHGSFLKKVRIGQHPDRARIVLDLNNKVSVDYTVTKVEKALIVELVRKK